MSVLFEAFLVFSFALIVCAQVDLSILAGSSLEVSGLSSDLVALSDNATAEVTLDVSLDISTNEFATLQGNVNATVNPLVSLIVSSTIVQLQAAVANYSVQIATSYNNFMGQQSEFQASLSANLSAWETRQANLSAEASVALQTSSNDDVRLEAVLVFHYVKAVDRLAAAALAIDRLRAIAIAARYQFAIEVMVLVNNTIAASSPTIAASMNWTVMDSTTIESNISGLLLTALIAEYRFALIVEALPTITADIAVALEEWHEKHGNFTSGTYSSQEEVRADFEANSTGTAHEISDRVTEFLDNCNRTSATVTANADSTVTVNLQIVRDDASSDSGKQTDVEQHVQVVIAAYAGVRVENVTVTVTSTTAITGKRSASQTQYNTQANIAPSSSGGPPGSNGPPGSQGGDAADVLANLVVILGAAFGVAVII